MKICGRAAGNSTLRKIPVRDASSVSIIRMYSRSTLARPSIVPTTIGKKQKSAITATFGSDAEPEDQHEHRREHDGRDALRRDQERIDGRAASSGEVQDDPEGEAGDDRDREADHGLVST